MVCNWVKWSLASLLIVGVLGCLLRLVLFAPVEGVNFRFFLHAHSHVAFLGWVFNALFAALVLTYVPDKAKKYKLLFWLLQLAVVGMLISFPIQGYAAFSIAFSTLHIFLSYWFAIKFVRDTSGNQISNKPLSLRFIRWSLFFMVLSSIGPFALGAIMANGLSGSQLYQLAIYFYLHFQYDGWFSFAVFGLFFKLMEDNAVQYSAANAKRFLWLMAIACIPAYGLSTLWTQPQEWVYIISIGAASLQLIALVYLFLILVKSRYQLKLALAQFNTQLMVFALGAFALKLILQFSSAFPAVAGLAYKVRPFTIGYLHIVFLGFVSVFLIAWLSHQRQINLNHKLAKTGMLLFLAGFILSEAIIFLQPLMIMMKMGMLPYGNQVLFYVSTLMPLGTTMLLAAPEKLSAKIKSKPTLNLVKSSEMELLNNT